MARRSRTKRSVVSLGLAAAIVLAPGCSTCRSVGGYYSSGQCYDDLGAFFLFSAGVLIGVFAGGGHGHGYGHGHYSYHGYNSHCSW